jgi:hypothetical protein
MLRALRWAGLAGVTLLLHALGRGALGPPPLTSAHQVATWWQERGPVLATFAGAREILWWIGCYLLTLGVLAVLACGRPSAGLIRMLSGCLPGATMVIRASIGASALGAALLAQAGSSFAGGDGAASGQGDSSPPVLRYAGALPGGRTATTAPALPHAGGVGTRPTGTTPASTALGPRRRTGEKPDTSAPSRPRLSVSPTPGRSHSARLAPGPPGEAGPGRTWTVRPGDSLWSIAEATLAAAWGHGADAPDLARYWWQVVETNRPSLPIPSNPDLLFPGDQVAVPLPPARPGSS